jgi:plasmid rolling circle replication initiator protein Rep
MAKLDLSNQDLSFENDFLVAVEWIDFENKENSTNQDNAIKFSSAVFSACFKDNINLKWKMKNYVKYTWNTFKSKRIF